MMPITLDCSSFEAALESLARLLGRTERELTVSLESYAIDAESCDPPQDQLARAVGFSGREALPDADEITWFHASRARPGSAFSEGLLPTNQALPLLWAIFADLAKRWVSDREWADYRRSFTVSDRYFAVQHRMKCQAPGWEGPFAFLVRDAAIGLHCGHKSFTSIPEVAEDICGDFEQVFGQPLRNEYVKATAPCLVVFSVPGPRVGAVGAALTYVYRTIHQAPQSLMSNTNFSGSGRAVAPKHIVRVEWLTA